MSEAGNILIVEDEAHLAQGLLFNLQAEGYRASIAGDGTAALDLLLNQRADDPFDAVLLDVMLPGKEDVYKRQALVISGFYGMNLKGLPLEENAYGAGIAFTVMVLVTGGLLWMLKRFNWL